MFFIDENKICERFWCREGGEIKLDDKGYLQDPNSLFYKSDDIKQYEDLKQKKYLILLGEPGIGKSTELRKRFRDGEKKSSKNQHFIFKDLKEYGDEKRLIEEIFDSKQIKQWAKSCDELFLFLDSFDECQINIKNLFQILKNQFNKWSSFSDRLYLRISSRMGNWINDYTSYFQELFSTTDFEVYNLAPLIENDIRLLLKINELDSDGFISEVEEKEIQPLAIYPLTLNQLILEFKKRKKFLLSRESYFYKACQVLSIEPNQDQYLNNCKSNSCSPEKRIALASRIAAIMIFCKKSTICLGNNFYETKASVFIHEILEGVESTDHFTFNFTQQDLIETITQTALFVKRGDLKFGFSNIAFLEYLSAKFISNHQLDIEQIISLITISTDEEGKVIPQLAGTAAWLNSIVPKYIDYSIGNDPQNAMLSNMEEWESEKKEKLVDSIFDKLDDKSIDDSYWGLRNYYHKLNHPNLAEKLKPYIENEKCDFLIKRVAIDMAEACNLKDLNEDLLKVIFNKKEKIYNRKNAIQTLSKTGDDEIKVKLKTLVVKDNNKDFEDDLKGALLNTLWPNLITTKEMFNVLTIPKKENYFGSYAGFIYNLTYNISVNDLDFALNWANKVIQQGSRKSYRLEKLIETILEKAWKNIPRLKNLSSFAKFLFKRLENFQSILPNSNENVDFDPFSLSRQIRIAIFKELIKIIPENKIFRFHQIKMVSEDDLDEILKVLKNFRKKEYKNKVVKVISFLNWKKVDQIDQIIKFYNKNKEFKKQFEHLLEPIEIKSDRAENIRSRFLEQQKWKDAEKKKNEYNKKIDVRKQLVSHLENFESTKDKIYWYQFFMDLTLDENSQRYGDEFHSNVLSLSGWQSFIDDSFEKRIIESAKYYIQNFNDSHNHWFGSKIFHRPAAAGYKSLILLYNLDKQFIIDLKREIWLNWRFILLDYPESSGFVGNDKTYVELIYEAYTKIPNEIIEITNKKIDLANKEKENYLFFLNKIDSCLDDNFLSNLFKKVKSSRLKTKIRSLLLDKLLEKNYNGVIDYTKNLILGSDKESKVFYALSLAKKCNAETWKYLMTQIEENKEFGKSFFLLFAKEGFVEKMVPLLNRINESQCGELYLWLVDNFPKEEDPVFDGAHMVGSRESVGEFRDNIIVFLRDKGSQESINILSNIKEKAKDINIDFHLIQAKQNFRKANWVPLRPLDLINLSNNPQCRIILNPTDLRKLIISSLKRLEYNLQGRNSMSTLLWNKNDIGKFKPKQEEDFSNFIERHLSDDLKKYGISSFREVQLRKPNLIKGGNKGEKTDIYVSFVNPDTKESLNVIIEIKGSNNTDVNTSMKNQLFERYMKTDNCSEGIYLVLWLKCDEYQSKNYIKSKSLAEARDKYSKEAKEISTYNKTVSAFVLDCGMRN